MSAGARDLPGIVLGFNFAGQVRDAFDSRFDVLGVIERADPALVTPTIAANARGFVTMGSLGVGEALMAAMPKLSIICCFGSGFEGIDLAAARRRNITVTNGGDANAPDVADMAMALLLASTRRVAQADRYVRDGKWTERGSWLGPVAGLSGGKLGILGLGAIGSRIATRAAAFEMEIGYHNRRRRDDVRWRYFETALALAEWCSYLVVACRADDSNRHLVDAGLLQALGPKGHLVNIARGSVIDVAALAAALAGKVIAGAGLDVFEEEPNVHPQLLTLENIVMTPHQGGATARAVRAMTDLVIRNLEAHFADRPTLTRIA